MKGKFRIKKIQIEDIEAWLNTPFIVEVPKYYVYAVQMRVMWFWVTIRTISIIQRITPRPISLRTPATILPSVSLVIAPKSHDVTGMITRIRLTIRDKPK